MLQQTVIKKIAMGSAFTALVLYAVKPEVMFMPTGEAKTWDKRSDENTPEKSDTPVPVWMAAAVVGILTPVFF